MSLIGRRLDCPCCQAWPKTIYPHGAGRTWSTECHDDWKREMGVEVVPHDTYRGAVEERDELRRLLELVRDRPDWASVQSVRDTVRAELDRSGGQ